MGKSNPPDQDGPVAGTGARLRAVADHLHNGNKSELARSLGMKPASFAKYTDGRRRPGATVLAKLSRMGVNVDWLLTGIGPMFGGATVLEQQLIDHNDRSVVNEQMNSPPADHSDRKLHRVPLVRIREDPEEGLQLRETGSAEWLSDSFIREHYGVQPELLRDFQISGDAMEDTIGPGDRVRAVLWDYQSPNDGSIYILRGPASLMIRRMRIDGDQIHLVGDHPEVPTQTVPMEKWNADYEPIARAIEVIQPL